MDLLYQIFLYLHVSSAILSIGPFFILIPIVKRLNKVNDEVQHAYIQIFQMSVRLVKHAGHVLVGSGVLLIAYSHWTWNTPWVIATLFVMFGSIFFLARAFSPVLNQFDDSNSDKLKLVKKLHRSLWIYLFLLMLMLWFMVTKPVIW